MWVEWDRLIKEILDSRKPDESQLLWWLIRLMAIGQQLRDGHEEMMNARTRDLVKVAEIADTYLKSEVRHEDIQDELAWAEEVIKRARGVAESYGVVEEIEDDAPF